MTSLLLETPHNPFEESDNIRAHNSALQSQVTAQHAIIINLYNAMAALVRSNEILAGLASNSGASAPVLPDDIARDAARILATLPPQTDS